MEKLLNVNEVCERLGICRATFFKHRAAYERDGLQPVGFVGGCKLKYREASVDALIVEAATTGNAIGQLDLKRRGRKAG